MKINGVPIEIVAKQVAAYIHAERKQRAEEVKAVQDLEFEQLKELVAIASVIAELQDLQADQEQAELKHIVALTSLTLDEIGLDLAVKAHPHRRSQRSKAVVDYIIQRNINNGTVNRRSKQ